MSLDARVETRAGALRLVADLTVRDGEVVALLGPNGAGKTTLLGAIAGLVPLEGGRVVLGGEVWEDAGLGVRRPPERRSAGILFQEGLLFPHLSALENVAFGPRCRGLPGADARRVAGEWLARVGLGASAGALPRTLSGGEARRVALARALAREPRLLLLDEPMTALDAAARLDVRRVLQAHLDGFAGPCLLVTHEPVEAIALADRLVVLEGGRVVQDGPAAEVARRPRSPWIARLVGLNLYQGTAAGHAVRVGQRGGEAATLVAAEAESGPVFAVVHPRAVALHPERPEGSPRNAWPVTVEGIDLHGDHVRVQLAGPLPLVAEITPGALAELELREGRALWAAVKASEVELYAR